MQPSSLYLSFHEELRTFTLAINKSTLLHHQPGLFHSLRCNRNWRKKPLHDEVFYTSSNALLECLAFLFAKRCDLVARSTVLERVLTRTCRAGLFACLAACMHARVQPREHANVPALSHMHAERKRTDIPAERGGKQFSPHNTRWSDLSDLFNFWPRFHKRRGHRIVIPWAGGSSTLLSGGLRGPRRACMWPTRARASHRARQELPAVLLAMAGVNSQREGRSHSAVLAPNGHEFPWEATCEVVVGHESPP